MSYFKVGVNVIAVPVEGIVFHTQVVTREISWRIPQIMKLVPQNALRSRWGRYNFHLKRQCDGRSPELVLTFTRRRFDGLRV